MNYKAELGAVALSLWVAACGSQNDSADAGTMMSGGAGNAAAQGGVGGASQPSAGSDGGTSNSGAMAQAVGGTSGAPSGGSGAGGTTPLATAGRGGSNTAGAAGPLGAGAGGQNAAGSGAAGAAGTAAFALTAVGVAPVSADEVAFPANALPPTNQSPEFSWTGVPADAKSLALTFRDLSAGAVKWVIWDIPPTLNHLPAGIASQASPAEVPGSSQLGSLGNQGYAGPCCVNNQYEWVLWALDVDKLAGTQGMSTAQIHQSILPQHDLAATKPLLMRIMR